EILFFGGVLCAYWVYRVMYPEAWALAAQQQIWWLGAINTIVLIVSSLTMALAVRASQLGQRTGTIVMLVLTLLFGSIFLGVKGYEYHEHYKEGLFPSATTFTWTSAQHPELVPKVELFMSFYFSRSEERRVGKECRSRWEPDQYKKKSRVGEIGQSRY